MPAYAYFHHMGWGWGILMTLGWLVLVGVFVALLYAAVRDRRAPSARELLDRRLANGEIGVEEYERARDALSRGEHGASTPGPAASG